MRLGRPRTGAEIECPTCRKPVYRSPSLLGRRYCGYACRDAAKRADRVKDGEARCAKCREWKPLAEFARNGATVHSYCKPCYSDWTHENKGTPDEKRRAYRPAYRLTEEEKKENKREANQRAHSARRAAGKLPGKFEITAMLCRQDGQCAYCPQFLTDYHIDHILPISRGGGNELSNLQLLCPRCNMKKGSLTHEEYIMSKRNRGRVLEYLRSKEPVRD